ncbi:MAG TPA: TolC family protein [Gemmatimonadaceae bacterium]|nr:TolC family protein [Gemmatimonadaceae bacterium]
MSFKFCHAAAIVRMHGAGCSPSTPGGTIAPPFLRALLIVLALPLAMVVAVSRGRAQAASAAAAQPAAPPRADSGRSAGSLGSLVAQALSASPAVHAAAARVKAARARVGPAGARPDPMLMAGVQNFPVSAPGFNDFMTMKMIGISQTFPFPGKLALQTRAAGDEVTAAHAALGAARLDVAFQVKDAYYELAFIDRALDIVRRNQAVLANLVAASSAQYATGQGTQADVLRARTETAKLGDAASALRAQRRSALARLNAVLDRPSDTPVPAPVISTRIVHAAVADSTAHVHFVSDALGAAAAGSPLLPLDSLQALAAVHSPMIHEHVARIAAQRARVALAQKAHLPDISVSLDYAQRQGFTDMVSAIVSIPIPLQKGRKQDAEAAEATAELATLEAQHHEMVNTLDAEVTKQVGELERARTHLALSKAAILPQAQATLASSVASYQVGRLDFDTVLDAQASVFQIETAYYRSLTDFAQALAALQHLVGTEVLR